jgi:hypothetical protein
LAHLQFFQPIIYKNPQKHHNRPQKHHFSSQKHRFSYQKPHKNAPIDVFKNHFSYKIGASHFFFSRLYIKPLKNTTFRLKIAIFRVKNTDFPIEIPIKTHLSTFFKIIFHIKLAHLIFFQPINYKIPSKTPKNPSKTPFFESKTPLFLSKTPQKRTYRRACTPPAGPQFSHYARPYPAALSPSPNQTAP